MNMDLLEDIYGKSLSENDKNIVFCENYLRNLEALDLNAFSEKLSVPILVPVGSRMLFRGELKRTNEVNVALGADYFTKCSVNQANILKQHRIEDTKSKLQLLKNERDYLLKQLSFSKQAITDDPGYDIIEVVTDEEDKNWRKQHRENVRQYKQRGGDNDEALENEMTNEQLWNRLDELELQEELSNELNKAGPAKANSSGDINKNMKKPYTGNNGNNAKIEDEVYSSVYSNITKLFQQPSKLHLFEIVVGRHNALKQMVAELKARQKESKNIDDLVERVDEMEQIEELEDEIAILEDMLASDDDDIEAGEEEEDIDNQQKKTVAFADEDESESFELIFKHSEVQPCSIPYDPDKGITKPSDIYHAYPMFFNGEATQITTSILKKPKCDSSPTTDKLEEVKEEVKPVSNMSSTIVVRDVVEKVNNNDDNNITQNERPMSLFKKRRQQLKE